MGITEVVKELELGMEESQNQRDKRVEELWRKLDPKATGELDLKGLQTGLKKIDHPMKNADDLLKDIIKAVDTNGDGKIQYEEFRVFVETAEKQLLLLFRSIDTDQDGRLNKDELYKAFRQAGMTVPTRRLSGFFDEIDMNRDGFISFDEWRDFLLFTPAVHDSDSPLEAALSFYSSIVTLGPEGDSMVSEETLEGLGTTGFLLQALFGSILKIAQPSTPPPEPSRQTSPSRRPSSSRSSSSSSPPTESYASFDQAPAEGFSQSAGAASSMAPGAIAYSTTGQAGSAAVVEATENAISGLRAHLGEEKTLDVQSQSPSSHSVLSHKARETRKIKLTQYLPEPGYFLAGAVAGGVSRTATAPLDRLKVYLLVNTKTSAEATLNAAKSGKPISALKRAANPIGEAIASLYRSGGLRTFFAGNGLNVVKIMPETAIKFGSYEAAKRTLATFEGHGDATQIHSTSKFVAGGLAGMTAQFCVYPLDTLKFRLQCETVEGGLKGNALLLQTAKKMYAAGGIPACYRGVTMGLIGMFPYSAIDMGTFELLKKTFTAYKARHYGIHEEDAAPGNFATGIIGATSGAFGATVVYPLNVLRTRLQTQGTVMHPPTYTGIWDVAHQTIRNEGVRGLYKGLTPNILKVAPALSITWIVYENSKKVLGLH